MSFTYALTIKLPTNQWLNLNDGINYKVGAASFNESATQLRRTEVTSPYVAGSFLVHAVPQNVVETIEIYCYGSTYAQAAANARAVIEAFSQITFQVKQSIDSGTYTYECNAADYSVKGNNTYVNSKMIPITFQFQRQPNPTFSVAS